MKHTNEELKSELKKNFGYHNFRDGQTEVIHKILNNQNILVVMPTGAGKSLCYQLPAIISNQATVVVSPLVSLMEDQSKGLKEDGIEVSRIHSGQDREENIKNWRLFTSGRSKILYLSPERLMQERMLSALRKYDVKGFVIDEAHCISKWGAQFRPEYEELSKLKDIFPEAHISAFTATADTQTRNDISKKLSIKRSNIIVRDLNRPNLYLEVKTEESFKTSLLPYLEKRRGLSGIVYCLSRRETDELAEFLRSNGFNSVAYHARKSPEEKIDAFDRFVTESDLVMVATIAFGMGIDKSDIRYVVHANIPSNIESFYQEIGRAGRDGLPSETLLFYRLSDLIKRQRMLLDGQGDEKYKLLEYKRLETLIGYCETVSCRRKALLSYFDQHISKCNNCDNCLHPAKVQDYSREARIIISTVQSTGQSFGSNHLLDVIQGKDTTKVKNRSHNNLPCFGLGREISKGLLQTLIRQLITSGALKLNLDRYGAIEITGIGLEILEKTRNFKTREYLEKQKLSNPRVSRPPAKLTSESTDLFNTLKKLRYKISKERNVPAYVIFPDKTLEQLASVKPTTETAFLEIDGIGPKKLEQYYDLFCLEISNHLTANKTENL